MTVETYKEMIGDLISKIINEAKNNPELIKEKLTDNKEIRESLINTLPDLSNELNTQIGDRYILNSANSTEEDREKVDNEIKRLNGEIQLRISGIKEFYDKLITELENLDK